MKKGLIVLVAAALLCCTVSLSAQQATHMENKTRLGLGLVIFDRSVLNLVGALSGSSLTNFDTEGLMMETLPPSHINVPIIMGTLKLEPEFGFFRQSNTTEVTNLKTTESFTAFRIGSGVFLMKHLPKVDIYYGGRIGIVRVSQTTENDYTTGTDSKVTKSQTNLFFGPCLGGEYFISNHFTFGGEAQFLWTKFGEPKTEIDPAPRVAPSNETKTSSSLMDTRYLFIFRWYMN
jgi:hypothetical protein